MLRNPKLSYGSTVEVQPTNEVNVVELRPRERLSGGFGILGGKQN